MNAVDHPPAKLSRFNHLVKRPDGTHMLYNAWSGGLAKIPDGLAHLIENAERNERAQSALLAHAGLARKLARGGFAVHRDADEVEAAFDVLRHASAPADWLALTIAPTMGCDFDCPYCFEDKSDTRGMSEETAKATIDFVARMLEGRRSLAVTWYGGEPTLALKRIENLSRALMDLCEVRRIPYSADIITNGYSLNPDTVRRLDSCRVTRYQITLDGPAVIHDTRRFHKTFGPSYATIARNIAHLMHDHDVDIRVNVDATNIGRLDDLVADLKARGIVPACGLHFSHTDAVTETSRGFAKSCLPMERFARETMSAYERMSASVDVPPPMPESPATCGALGSSSFVIDPRGRLYRCWTTIGEEEECVGTVYAPDALVFDDIFSHFTIAQDAECRACSVLPICLGGCPYKWIKLKDSEGRCIKWKYILADTLEAVDAWRNGSANEPGHGATSEKGD